MLGALALLVPEAAGQSTTQVWLDYAANRNVEKNLGLTGEISFRELIAKGEWTELSLRGVSQYNPEGWLGLIGGLTLQQV